MSSATAGASADLAHASRRAIVAACVGNAAEWYDFAIYGSLATVIGLVFFPTQDLAIALSAAFATYGTAFLVRPLGALVFGRLGDAQGRRTVLVRVVFLMAGCCPDTPRLVCSRRLSWCWCAPLKGSQPEENSALPPYSSWRTRPTHGEARLQPGTQRRWRLE